MSKIVKLLQNVSSIRQLREKREGGLAEQWEEPVTEEIAPSPSPVLNENEHPIPLHAVPPISRADDPNFEPQLLPIASGKGGVGKTNISVNLSIALSERLRGSNKRVLLVDGDFGLPNADILLGAKTERTLEDFAKKEISSLTEAISATRFPNLYFLSGSDTPSLTLANMNYQQRQKFMRHMRSLEADYIILDLGASTHFEVLDFFSMVNYGIVVLNPEPTAIRDSLIFIRHALIRRIRQEMREFPRVKELLNLFESPQNTEIKNLPQIAALLEREHQDMACQTFQRILEKFRPQLIINRAESYPEGLAVINRIRNTTRSIFGIDVEYLGPVFHDEVVSKAVKKEAPFLIEFPESQAARTLRMLEARISGNPEDYLLSKNYFSFGDYIQRLIRR